MTRAAGALTRQQRRIAERESRRDERRDRQRQLRSKQAGLSVMAVSIAALVLGLAGVVAMAIVGAPPPPVELQEPSSFSPANLQDGMALGSASAPVTIDLWSDYQCPACGAFTKTMEPRLVADYVVPGKVRIVYHDLSFLGSESVDAAIAARVAGETGLYWQYHDYLFANQSGEQQGAFNQARLEAIAAAVGLDVSEFRANQNDAGIRQQVAEQDSLGAQAGVSQTPTLILSNGQRIVGVPRSYDDLRAAIDSALGGGSVQ
jgi:protein-disulfide isomerase